MKPLLLLLFVSLVFSKCGPYKFGFYTFDFTPIAGKIFHADNVIDPSDNLSYNYDYSPCEDMSKSCSGVTSGFCQEWLIPHKDEASFGYFSNASMNGDQLILDYINGSPSNGIPRSVKLILACDSNVEMALDSVSNIIGTSSYKALARSKYACPEFVNPVYLADVTISIIGNNTFSCVSSGACTAVVDKGEGICFYHGGIIKVNLDEKIPKGVDISVEPDIACSNQLVLSGSCYKTDGNELKSKFFGRSSFGIKNAGINYRANDTLTMISSF